MNTSTINVQTRKSDDKLKVPLVYIKKVSTNKNLDNVSTFISSLMTILDSVDFICKSTTSYLIVHTHFVEHYNLLLSHSEENYDRYHFYQSDINRPLHIVIRNLHLTTAHEDIIAGLSELKYHVTKIHNIKRFTDKTPLPLFFVDIQKATNNSDIYKIEFLLNSKIVVGKPYPPKSPPQCYACQTYGYTWKYCFHNPRYVKCGEKPFSYSFTKPPDSPARCALCNGSHTANYKSCSDYKKTQTF